MNVVYKYIYIYILFIVEKIHTITRNLLIEQSQERVGTYVTSERGNLNKSFCI